MIELDVFKPGNRKFLVPGVDGLKPWSLATWLSDHTDRVLLLRKKVCIGETTDDSTAQAIMSQRQPMRTLVELASCSLCCGILSYDEENGESLFEPAFSRFPCVGSESRPRFSLVWGNWINVDSSEESLDCIQFKEKLPFPSERISLTMWARLRISVTDHLIRSSCNLDGSIPLN